MHLSFSLELPTHAIVSLLLSIDIQENAIIFKCLPIFFFFKGGSLLSLCALSSEAIVVFEPRVFLPPPSLTDLPSSRSIKTTAGQAFRSVVKIINERRREEKKKHFSFVG